MMSPCKYYITIIKIGDLHYTNVLFVLTIDRIREMEMLLTRNNLVLVRTQLYVRFSFKCILLRNCTISDVLALVDNVWQ